MTIEANSTAGEIVRIVDKLSAPRNAAFRNAARADFVVGNFLRAGFNADGTESPVIAAYADNLQGRAIAAAIDAGADDLQAARVAKSARRDYVQQMRGAAVLFAYRQTHLARDGGNAGYPAPLARVSLAKAPRPVRVSLAKPPFARVSLAKPPLQLAA